ncbi:MAG: hypothetical protein ACI4QL_06545 [Candidatus Fimimonas sp.]
MRLKIFRILLLFWTFFVGIGALVGGTCMLIKPDGSILQMQSMLPYFQVLPFADVLFQDYVFAGIMLILINGVTNVAAAVLVLMNKKIGYVLGTIFGITLMLWITIQFVIFPFFLIDLLYFVFGVLQFVCGYVALVSYNQKFFPFDENDYKNIDSNSNTLVVFFSRKGFTKKIAYELANEQAACILELTTKERTSGDLGFWWCGRFAMHRWQMSVNEVDLDLSQFSKVVIVTPVWVFRMSAPIRDFVVRYQAELLQKEVTVVFNHFNPWLPKGAIVEMEKYVKPKNTLSKTTMLGHTFEK